MSAHKTNPEAVLRAMLPPLLPPGCQDGIDFRMRVVPAAGVLLVPAEHMREPEPGKFEIRLQAGKDEWGPPPEGIKLVHPIGKPLTPELCDVVVMFGTVVQDNLGAGLVTATGQRPRFNTSTIIHGELMRMPLLAWQKQHMDNLRGPVV